MTTTNPELYIIQRAYLRYIGHANVLSVTLECRANGVGVDVDISEDALKQLIEKLYIDNVTRGDIEDINISEYLDHVPVTIGFDERGIATTIASPLDPGDPIELHPKREEPRS